MGKKKNDNKDKLETDHKLLLRTPQNNQESNNNGTRYDIC